MKKIISILIFILVLATVFLLRHKPITHIGSDAVPTPSNSNSIKGRAEVVSSNGSVQVMLPLQTAPPAIINDRDKPEAFKQSIEGMNSPIEFYGKVIDQDCNAVSGAKVSIGIRQWYVRSIATFDVGAHFISAETKSGEDRCFEIHGKRGDGFGVGITKDGYELEPNRYGFGSTAGSYDNPVIFKMWSTNIHEQLITGDKSFEIQPNGNSHVIDLTTGTIAETGNGDLKVWIRYTNQVAQGQLYDWSAGIEVINGGFMEMPHNITMYSAPTDGYTNSFQLHQHIKGGQSGA